MAKFTSPLNNLKIASPCSQDWGAMIGSDRRRFCGECKLNVYNLSGMTRAEAENLLLNSEGRLCVRFYKRADGTVLTKDCPVGWQALKKRISRTAAAFVSLLFGLLSGLGLMSLMSQPKRERVLMGAIAYQPTPAPKQTPEDAVMGDVFVMGNIAVPTPMPKATPKNKQAAVGRLAEDFQRERSRERQ
ncbi:MAG TPA: hypothetical protein VK400_01020 [Pyrinomonadaceae bacterium]|nr:hypothetical protein [Pyrinomonadaceae bacterium]